MREILFRGKSASSNEWVYGNLIIESNDTLSDYLCQIVPISMHEKVSPFDFIIPETIGQYTGLTDKNGKKIFEGDIVKGKDALEKDLEVYGYIDHKNGSFVIVGDFMTHYRWLDYEVEIIGNIHDNPELLKGGVE